MKSSIRLLIPIFFLFSISNLNAQNPLTDSLIAWYPFTGNTLDSSGNNNNGIVYGPILTSDRFGNGSAAFSFDGVNDYIELAAGALFKPTTFPISVTAWIKSNIINSPSGGIFRSDMDPDHYTGILFQVIESNGTLEIWYGDGGTTSSCCRRSKHGVTNVNDDQWHFVAAVIRGDTDMDLYVDCHYENGTYDGSGDNVAYTSSNGTVAFNDVVLGNYYYKGSIDDIRYYHRELTQSDLQFLFTYPAAYNYSPASVTLGVDTGLCAGTILLDPVTSGTVQSYLWSDGSTDSTLLISEQGEYWVQIFDGCGYISDTIQVGKSGIVPTQLPNDTTLCLGQFFILDAGNGYDSYLWSNGAFTQSIAVFSTGTYSVTVTNDGCVSTDSVSIDFVVCQGIDETGVNGVKMFFDEEQDALMISFPSVQSENALMKIFSAEGRQVLQKKIPENIMNAEVSMQQFPEGIYFAILEDKNGLKKIVFSKIK